MYYLIPKKEPTASPPAGGEAFVSYLTLEELEKDHSVLEVNREILEICKEKNPHSILLVREGYRFIILPLPSFTGLKKTGSPIGLYFDTQKILIIALTEEKISEGFFYQALDSPSKISSPGHFLFAFLREVLRDHYENYLDYETKIQDLEQLIWQTENKSRGLEIELSTLSRELLILQNFYDELSELLSRLEENESATLSADELLLLASIHGRVDHYAGNIRFLRDYLGGVRASYQAQLDLSMNEVMKLFTVLSAVFLPLTLLVGWYGMNFQYMPELGWRYGYLTVGGLSLIIAGLILYYFRNRRLL